MSKSLSSKTKDPCRTTGGNGGLTRRHCILDYGENCWFKSPVSLPISHIGACLEVLRQVIDPDRPTALDKTTEPTAAAYIRSRDLPRVHTPVVILDIVNEFQVLAQVVLAVECSLIKSLLLASRVVVTFDVGIVGVGRAAEDTAHLIGLRYECPRATRAADPSF